MWKLLQVSCMSLPVLLLYLRFALLSLSLSVFFLFSVRILLCLSACLGFFVFFLSLSISISLSLSAFNSVSFLCFLVWEEGCQWLGATVVLHWTELVHDLSKTSLPPVVQSSLDRVVCFRGEFYLQNGQCCNHKIPLSGWLHFASVRSWFCRGSAQAGPQLLVRTVHGKPCVQYSFSNKAVFQFLCGSSKKPVSNTAAVLRGKTAPRVLDSSSISVRAPSCLLKSFSDPTSAQPWSKPEVIPDHQKLAHDSNSQVAARRLMMCR